MVSGQQHQGHRWPRGVGSREGRQLSAPTGPGTLRSTGGCWLQDWLPQLLGPHPPFLKQDLDPPVARAPHASL